MRTKKYEGDNDTNHILSSWKDLKDPEKEFGGAGASRKDWAYLLGLARIMRKFLVSWGDLLSYRLQ